MGYWVHFQTEPIYKNVAYGGNSIYNSACGCAALCNALEVLNLGRYTVREMCEFSVANGARVEGGTDEARLLKCAAPVYGFEYHTTSKNAELLEHLKAGGVAILHGGSAYKLFSNSGHFVCAAAAKGNTITVLDSYWYKDKYTSTALRANNTDVIEKGVIEASLTQCGKATIDRSPSYYLISKKTAAKTETKPEVQNLTEQETKQLFEKMWAEKQQGEAPEYFKKSWQNAQDAGLLDGTNPNGFTTRAMIAELFKRLGFIGK